MLPAEAVHRSPTRGSGSARLLALGLSCRLRYVVRGGDAIDVDRQDDPPGFGQRLVTQRVGRLRGAGDALGDRRGRMADVLGEDLGGS